VRCVVSIESVGRFEVMFRFFLWTIEVPAGSPIASGVTVRYNSVSVKPSLSMNKVPWRVKVTSTKYVKVTKLQESWNAIRKFHG